MATPIPPAIAPAINTIASMCFIPHPQPGSRADLRKKRDGRSLLRYVASQAHMNCYTSFFLSALLVFSTQASAENRENPCESGSGVGSYICAEKELKSASKILSQTYKNLTVEVSKDKGLVDLLGSSQKSWLLHVDQTCKFVMSAFPGHVSWMSARELWCKERQYNQRNLELTEVYECLTEGGAKCTY